MPTKKQGIILIGVDGATFDIIKPMVAEGKLPCFRFLMQKGHYTGLLSTIPPVTIPAWPSMITGKKPEKHKVFDFSKLVKEKISFNNRQDIQGKCLWDYFLEQGKKVGLMNIPGSYPPFKLNGFMLTGMMTPYGKTYCYPNWLNKFIKKKINKDYQILPSSEKESSEDYLKKCLEVHKIQEKTFFLLMEKFKPELMFAVFQLTDLISHNFWHQKERVEKAYQIIDETLGKIMRKFKDYTLIIASDHGFGQLDGVVNLNTYFLKKKLLFLKKNAWTKIKKLYFDMGLTPKNIYQAGSKAKVNKNSFISNKHIRKFIVDNFFLSYNDIDWKRTVCFSLGQMGLVHMNHRNKQLSDEEKMNKTIQALRQMRLPSKGKSILTKLVRINSIQGPDLFVVMDNYKYIAYPFFSNHNKIFVKHPQNQTGAHREEGILIIYDKNIEKIKKMNKIKNTKNTKKIKKMEKGHTINMKKIGEINKEEIKEKRSSENQSNIFDIVPTILKLEGMKIPKDLDGESLI